MSSQDVHVCRLKGLVTRTFNESVSDKVTDKIEQ